VLRNSAVTLYRFNARTLKLDSVTALQRYDAPVTAIAVCHSRKGGVGKSFLAYELAYLLDAVLVDLEHDGGGVTSKWGYRPQDHPRARLLDALQPVVAAPRPLRGFKKPALVPGHPDLYDHQPDADTMADALALSRWSVSAPWKNRWGEHRNGVVQGPPLPGRDHQPLRVAVLSVPAELS
jgi:hypothetical protein